jgi:hypothetical protein
MKRNVLLLAACQAMLPLIGVTVLAAMWLLLRRCAAAPAPERT